jgi:hypothetical protein
LPANDAAGLAKWDNLTLMAQKFAKTYTSAPNNNSPTWLKASLETVDILGKEITRWCGDEDEKIGYVYLNYYADPNTFTYSSSAESGGVLGVWFSDGIH